MPTQIYIGPAAINTYSLGIALGAIVAVVWLLWNTRGSPAERTQSINGLLIVAIASVLAGRIGYILLHIDYFREDGAEIGFGASPGYVEQATIAGGIIGWLIAERLQQHLPADALIVAASLVGIGATLGCIPNGCAYGREVYWTDGLVWQLRVDWPDAYTLSNPRLPVQLFMAGWLLVCGTLTYLIITARRRRIRYDCRALCVWLLLFAAGDFILQFLRADPTIMLGALRTEQLLDLGLALSSAVVLIRNSVMRRSAA